MSVIIPIHKVDDTIFMKINGLQILHKIDWNMAIAKSIAILISYLIGFHLTGRFHDESRYFGAMLAAIASVVALQADLKSSITQGGRRVLGTFIGAVIATIYLSIFPYSVMGMILSVFILQIVCMALSIPDNGKMATIALIVIMLISQKNPEISPVINGLLRFIETAVGAVVGITMAWLMILLKRIIAKKQ